MIYVLGRMFFSSRKTLLHTQVERSHGDEFHECLVKQWAMSISTTPIRFDLKMDVKIRVFG
jgi:hypothetical protein